MSEEQKGRGSCAIIRQVKYRGGVVSMHGSLRFDYLPPQIFQQFTKDAPGRCEKVSGVTYDLTPQVLEDFNVLMLFPGDKLILPCHGSQLRAALLDHWRMVVYRDRFRERFERAAQKAAHKKPTLRALAPLCREFTARVMAVPIPKLMRMRER